MSTIHARGQRLLNRTTGDTAGTGTSVTYTRASGTGAGTATLVATPYREQPDATAVPVQGTRSADRGREYVIVYADLVAGGFGEPAEGDRITETLNGVAKVFEISRHRTEPAWRWADEPTRTRVVVHTREK